MQNHGFEAMVEREVETPAACRKLAQGGWVDRAVASGCKTDYEARRRAAVQSGPLTWR